MKLTQNKALRRLLAAGALLAGALSLLVPAAAARWTQSRLLAGPRPRPVAAGVLSGAARENPLLYALYRRYYLTGSGRLYAGQPADPAAQAELLAGQTAALQDAGVLPGAAARQAEQLLQGTVLSAGSAQADGFAAARCDMQAPGGILVVETLQHIDTGLVVYYQAGVDTAGLDAAALLDRYRDYLGLASLGDWQETETGTSASFWSPGGQVTLHCALDPGGLLLEAVCTPEETAG